MKFILLSLLTFSVLSSGGDKDIKPLLCDQKWLLGYVRYQGQLIKVPPMDERELPWILFNSNGDFSQNLESKLTKGSWSYDEEANEITTIEKKEKDIKAILKVIILNKDSLELRTPDKSIIGLYHGKQDKS